MNSPLAQTVRDDRPEPARNAPWRNILSGLAFAGLAALAVSGEARAQIQGSSPLQSAGALAFGPGNVLFVGDTRAAEIHAYQLPADSFTDQSDVAMGDARTFNGRDLVRGVDRQIAALLGTTADQVIINDMVVHQPSQQIFLSVERGRGPDAKGVIVKVDHGRLQLVDLEKVAQSSISLTDEPDQQRLEFGQRERDLAITDIEYVNGEILVAGLSNEEFSSKLRRIRYPFDGRVSTSSIEIWHSTHAQFETRAPIIRMLVHPVGGQPYLFAVYACAPLVRIPLAALTDGARVRGETIGELGYGSTPVDMLTYVDPSDRKDYLLITNNMRNAARVAVADLGAAPAMPVNVGQNFGPAGVAQYPIPVTGAQHLRQVNAQWVVEVRRYPVANAQLDLHSLPLPYLLDRADQIVEMNWPNGPDPFGYHAKPAK